MMKLRVCYTILQFVEIYKTQNIKHLLQKQKEEQYKFHLKAQIIQFLIGVDKIKVCFGFLVGFFVCFIWCFFRESNQITKFLWVLHSQFANY